jgi:integrase
MARRRRGQFPEPFEERGLWKVKYWDYPHDVDGTKLPRVKRTKCLGRVGEVTIQQARKQACKVVEPINDAREGSEHRQRTMAELFGAWRSAIKSTLKLSTQVCYEWAIKKWIGPAFGPARLSDIGRSDVQIFLTSAAQRLAPESVRDLRARLRGLLSSAVEWGWVERNAAAGKFKMPARRPVRQKVILTPENFHRLIGDLRQPYRTLVILAVMAGLRKGELEALRRSDNVMPGVVVVDEATYRAKLDSPKTERSGREVAIDPLVQVELDAWKAQARYQGPDDFLFGQKRNRPARLDNAVKRHVKPACDRLGIPRVSWHDLRHTFTTWGRKAGVAPEALRDQLGHSSVSMTLDVYSHVEDRVAAAAALAQFAGLKPVGGLM